MSSRAPLRVRSLLFYFLASATASIALHRSDPVPREAGLPDSPTFECLCDTEDFDAETALGALADLADASDEGEFEDGSGEDGTAEDDDDRVLFLLAGQGGTVDFPAILGRAAGVRTSAGRALGSEQFIYCSEPVRNAQRSSPQEMVTAVPPRKTRGPSTRTRTVPPRAEA